MRRKKGGPYLLFACVLIALFTVMGKGGDQVRIQVIGWVSPLWRACLAVKEKTFTPPPLASLEATIADLKRENRFLLDQIENIKLWLLQEDRVEEEMERLRFLGEANHDPQKKDYFLRRQKELTEILQLHMEALPAKVIYREPSSWSSFIWINLGEKQNKHLHREVVAKNSPVVVGHVLVGVVEEVYASRSKVRLITDSRLVPAVRAVRGESQSKLLYNRIEDLIEMLHHKPELFSSEKEGMEFFAFLRKMEGKSGQQEDVYLAKGELHGASHPLWRSRGQMLKGVGFNYDFADGEGVARDLRTGERRMGTKKDPMALLQEGDILITSGLDGVFPPGLEVGEVSFVECLQEGECSYQIRAQSLAPDLNELKMVFVLPPLNAA